MRAIKSSAHKGNNRFSEYGGSGNENTDESAENEDAFERRLSFDSLQSGWFGQFLFPSSFMFYP